MPTDEDLRNAYHRGVAIFPPVGCKGCDIVIPVAMPKDNSMAYFVVHVKNCRRDKLIPPLRTEAQNALRAASAGLPRVPAHMAMMMCLRTESDRGAIEVVNPVKTQSTEHRTATRGDKTEGHGTYKLGEKFFRRVMFAAVGMDPGLGFTDEPEKEPETVEIVDLLRRLLDCTSEVAARSPYHDRLTTLGYVFFGVTAAVRFFLGTHVHIQYILLQKISSLDVGNCIIRPAIGILIS